MTTGAPFSDPEVRVARAPCGVVVVSLLGEHDIATAAEIRYALFSALEQGAGIVVDLSETELIDSSIIYALVDARLLASERGSRISFQLQTDAAANRVLEICGLLKVWPVYGTRAEAIAAVSQTPEHWTEHGTPVRARGRVAQPPGVSVAT